MLKSKSARMIRRIALRHPLDKGGGWWSTPAWFMHGGKMIQGATGLRALKHGAKLRGYDRNLIY